MTRLASIVSLFALLTAACSSDEGTAPKPADGTTPPDEPEWTTLAEKQWTLGPGGEYPDLCAKVELTRDTYISAIRPIHPRGTHHTFVALGDSGDEAERCTEAVISGTMIYAAGVGSEGLTLPEGVALKLPAGKFLNLSLHLYNSTTETLAGTSGMQVIEMDPADVQYEAGTLLAGPLGFQLPPGESTIKHDCTITAETTGFALFPHMHQFGTHLKTTVTVGGVTKLLHDDDYDFEEQRQFPIDPLRLLPGDKISTECTYQNPGPNPIRFGESSDTEMCFSVMFRYPNSSGSFCLPAGSRMPGAGQ